MSGLAEMSFSDIPDKDIGGINPTLHYHTLK